MYFNLHGERKEKLKRPIANITLLYGKKLK